MAPASAFLRTKLLASAFFVALALAYANFRINSTMRALRGGVYHTGNYWVRFGGPQKLIDEFEKAGPVLISLNGADGYYISAETLYLSDLTTKDLLQSQNIDLCTTKSDCKTMDIRLFIDEYFKEIKSAKDILRGYVIYDEEVCFDVYPDSEISSENEIKLSVLGFMFGLLVLTRSFIRIKFLQPFLYEDRKMNDYLGLYLYRFDQEQYEIFKEIKQQFYPSNRYIFRENSSKPFQRYFQTSASVENYDSQSFPLDRAAEAILIFPFKNSRTLIIEAMQRVLDYKYHFFTYSEYYYSSDTILIDHFSDSKSPVNLHQWKDHSIYDQKSRIFWKALSKLSKNERMAIFELATGFDAIPFDGLLRLPKTEINIGESSGLFKDRFKIVIGPHETSESLEKILLKYAKDKLAEKRIK